MTVLNSLLGFMMGIFSVALAFIYFVRSNDLTYRTHIGHFVLAHNFLGAMCLWVSYGLFNNVSSLTVGKAIAIGFAFLYLLVTRNREKPWWTVPKHMESSFPDHHHEGGVKS